MKGELLDHCGYVVFRKENMTWPLPTDHIEWRLRYAPDSITREDQLKLASLVNAYETLIHGSTVDDHQAILSELRRLLDEAHLRENNDLDKDNP